jgi:hypothetical protein
VIGMPILKASRWKFFSVFAVCLALISACSSASSTAGPGATASVASLATPSTSGKHSPKTVVAERPLIRPDTSDAERARMNKVYLNCLRNAGVSAAKIAMFAAKQGVSSDVAAKYGKQCGSQQPQQLFDKARESDPEFADDLRADIACLNQHGIRAETREDGEIWLLDDLPPDDKAHWLDDCEQKAFGGYYRTLK